MRLNQCLFTVTALIIFLTATTAAWALDPAQRCPVMPDHKINGKVFTEYKGRKIGFCCKSCLKKFNKHPKKYLKNIEGAIDREKAL